MATSPINNMTRQLGAKKTLSYPVDTAGSHDFNAGDLVAFDGTELAALTASTTSATFAGVAQNSSYLGIYAKDGAVVKNYSPSVEVIIGQVHRFQTSSGDSISHMTPMYCGADAQTVTSQTSGHDIIGYAYLPQGGTLSGSDVGAGKYVEVLVVPTYPVSAIA